MPERKSGINLFSEPLKGKSTYELARWILNLRDAAHVNNEFSFLELKSIYNAGAELLEYTDSELETNYPADLAEVLIENRKVILGPKYRRAILALARPFPQFQVKPGKRDAPADISKLVYSTYEKRGGAGKGIDDAVNQFAAEYEGLVDGCLNHKLRTGYRDKIAALIYSRHVCRYVTYAPPEIGSRKRFDKLSPAQIVVALKGTPAENIKVSVEHIKKWNQQHYLGQPVKGSESTARAAANRELSEFGISVQVKDHYLSGVPIEKLFMVRLAYYLGLDAERANKLLAMEGYALSGSVRPWDVVVWNCLRLGLPVEYANFLLVHQYKLKPINQKSVKA